MAAGSVLFEVKRPHDKQQTAEDVIIKYEPSSLAPPLIPKLGLGIVLSLWFICFLTVARANRIQQLGALFPRESRLCLV